MKSKVVQRRPTVLIIDNNEDTIAQLTKILTPHVSVIAVRDGKTGIDTLRMGISKFSAVIMSGTLPIPDKFEYLHIIHNDNIFKSIPVIVCTDSAEPYEEVWLDYGAVDYIVRPLKERLVVERIKNIIRLKETSSVLESLEYDELTGLLTRQAFIHHATLYVNRAPENQYCILGIDVENFKLTNTLYGEERCDNFLAYIAGRFIGTLETGFAGRFGGDQFVALFEMKPYITTEYIQKFMEEILASAPLPHQTVKIGVYAPIDTSLPIVRCCDRAFLAIREVKGSYGKDIVYYEDRIQQQLLNEQRIIESMEKALEEEQFKVFYQPKHETVTGKIAGAEALIRWEHPEYGFMSPGQFIPLFEKNGFITKIDSFVMKKVCSDIVSWQKDGIPVVPVSVNISRRDFFEQNWIDNNLKLIDEMGIDHSLIHMEVTESMYSERVEYIIEQVKKVQELGYMIEMDDFGSGYSSLGLLSTFPLNIIKLDISFVRHIDVNEIVIENIIKMAHSMGFLTVAEGAETKEEFKILKELGCDLIQGYVFSKPLSSVDYERYLRHNACTLEPLTTHLSLASNGQINDALLMAASEVAEGIPGGFFTYHANGNGEVITFNKEVLKLYECENGADFRKFTGNRFDGMVFEEDLQFVKSSIDEQISEKNNLVSLEYRILCKNKKIKYVRAYGRFVQSDKLGSICYIFLNDFTEEHNKLIEEKKINEVIQGISQTYSSIFLIDYETKKITPYAIDSDVQNRRGNIFENITDYEDFISIYTNNCVKAEDIELMRNTASIENIKKELEQSQRYNFTYRLKEPINNMSLVEMAIRKLKDENSSSRAVITFRPIAKSRIKVETEKNVSLMEEIEQHARLEEDYKLDLKRAINKAEVANKAKNIFIDNITKQLLILLNNLVANLQLAKDNVDNKQVLIDSLGQVQNSQEKLSFTINNIIELSKTESGNLKINEVPVDLTGAIDRIFHAVEDSVAAKDIEIETWYEVANPYFYQDVAHTAEFVHEILLNAIKYTPVGGKIAFGLRQLPGKSADECVIEFVCKDTGIGISEDFLPKIFERFNREENDLNNEIPSSGIGLKIAKSIIDLMGGTIEITSELGKGTEVKVLSTHRFAKKEDIAENGYISTALKNC